MSWKARAQELFVQGEKITDISKAVGISRRMVSGFFKTMPEELIRQRGAIKQTRREEYQKQWDRTNRIRKTDTAYERVKRQHDIDVRVLSAERY